MNERASRIIRTLFLYLAWMLVPVFLGLAIIGGYEAYSPVPMGDMWNGTLGFYVNASHGNWSAWWAQHNEHRILLSRILFWMEEAWFSGTGLFLLVTNYLLVTGVVVLFFFIWRERSRGWGACFGAFLSVWLLSWIQNDNMIWGFQSQFVLAQLLPLMAFYFLHRACQSNSHGGRWFAASAACGVMALGSMANGVITLPLLTLLALALRMNHRRVLILAALSVLGVFLYFHGYKAVGGHGSLTQSLQQIPEGVIDYMQVYLGGPFYFFLGENPLSLMFARIASVVLVVGSIICLQKELSAPHRSSLALAMLCFILYIGGSAFGTAGGRAIFGATQALTSRYMTPALMAWAAFFVLVVPGLKHMARGIRWFWGSLFALLVMSMLSYQLRATTPRTGELYDRSLATLAVEMRIPDQTQIAHIFGNAEWVLRIARTPSEQNLSVFALYPYADLYEQLGKPLSGPLPPHEFPRCQGFVDEVQPIPEDPRYLRVRGWAFDRKAPSQPLRLTIVDEQGVVSGFVLSGLERPDVAALVDPKAGTSGYRGYVRADLQGKRLFFVGEGMGCRVETMLPTL
ncbi:hypothetical protein [Lautropia mirabilis]|uniref:hypothetical protein n=1 Tax=Lautropia mirabilis TaxID=47671 RepID=UPI0028E8C21B|nr:hypothetical protein [Lautropia mirabilis]